MGFKSVLVVVTSEGQAKVAIEAAARVAMAQDGHLDVLAVGLNANYLGYTYLAAGAVLSQISFEQAETDAKAAETAARAVLKGLDPSLRWSLDTAVAEMGAIANVVGNAASFVDLVVQTRPYGGGQDMAAEAVVESALFDAHAPVLIVPPEADLNRIANPRRILLAWNQSAEALTAAKRALPLLKNADYVDVTVVDPPARGPERSDPGGQLCQFMSRHGVKAEVTVLARTRPKVSEVLAQHAIDRNSDMMVMGAYGHGGLSNFLGLGGATAKVIAACPVPLLLAH